MVNCKLCSKSFKNTQGLSGHMSFLHGVRKDTPIGKLQEAGNSKQLKEASTEQAESAVEKRLRYIERALGITEGTWQLGSIERALGRTEPLLRANELSKLKGQVAELTEQVNKHDQLIEQLNASTEARRVEIAAVLERVEKLEESLNELRQNVSPVVPWAENCFSTVTSDLDQLFQALDCHRHSGKSTCSLSTIPSVVKSFDQRLDLANTRRGKLPMVITKYANQLFYKDKPDDGQTYILLKGVGWTLAKQRD